MPLRHGLCALLLMLLAGAMPTFAQDGTAPSISLVTFAPGEVYWQRFGHNALLVREAGGRTRLYNYGIFDFQQKNFFFNFARGHMQYRLAEEPLSQALRPYVYEGRWAYEQRLRLTPQQALSLAEFLDWNAQPQHAEYRYDYFTANCSTRVRDALNRALGGTLERKLRVVPTAATYRNEVTRLMAGLPPLAIGMDLGMGSHGDVALNQWQHAFLPDVLMRAVAQMEIVDEQGVVQPLVEQSGYLLSAPDPVVPTHAPQWTAISVAAGVIFAIVLLSLYALRSRPFARLVFAIAGSASMLVFGLFGLVLLAAWVLTEHWAMAANYNLLLLHPLWLAMIPLLWRGSRRAPLLRPLAVLTLLLSLAAIPAALLGVQPILDWLLLLLPAQLVLLFALLRPDPARA